ncbi:Tim44-like domain-containing protein [Oceanimonas sp. CHS3-5]|uniref:Tim44 domain-containing protein n=1 Tax=Oceanimonas sp. CHS3-5 TaxID=3068186 RepID=UPI00273E9479|nr:Tim44-like domain-containing protein [Oceanimonas sp. CHS3-5]MDP5292218.1 Tim44-like domain-containing protein [Oceanimonas sp. CHS3-5]
MRKLLALFTLIFAVGLTTTAFDAEARKMGGGSRSIGKSFKTAPAQPTQQNINRNNTSQTQPQSKKSGLMGGILGGLLAGGLFAALLGSGAFEGFQFMDFLLIAGLAFGAVMLFRALRRSKAQAAQPAYNGPQRFEAPPAAPAATGATGGFGATDVPFNLPPGFDMQAFLQGSREHYRTLQEAWNQNNLEKMREYLSPELFAELSRERATLSGDQHTEVMFVDAELVRADHTSYQAQVSLKFSGRYRDSAENVEQDINEIWHLERDLTQANSPWLIVGLEDLA